MRLEARPIVDEAMDDAAAGILGGILIIDDVSHFIAVLVAEIGGNQYRTGIVGHGIQIVVPVLGKERRVKPRSLSEIIGINREQMDIVDRSAGNGSVDLFVSVYARGVRNTLHGLIHAEIRLVVNQIQARILLHLIGV